MWQAVAGREVWLRELKMNTLLDLLAFVPASFSPPLSLSLLVCV